jgi:hypothetical protein
MAEKKVDIGYWDGVYFMIFVWAILRCKVVNIYKKPIREVKNYEE